MSTGNTPSENISITGLLVHNAAPRMLLMSMATVAAGTAAAALRGNMELLPATLCLLFALFVQIAGTYMHFYVETRRRKLRFDDEVVDPDSLDDALGQLPRASVLRASASAFMILAATVGLALLAMGGLWTLLVAVVLVAVVWLTFMAPRPMAETSLGVVSTFLLFGPVGVIGTCLAQSGHEASSLMSFYDVEPSLYLSVVMGLMAVNCGIFHNIASRKMDMALGKQTFPVVAGKRLSLFIFGLNGILWVVALGMLCLVQNLTGWLWYMTVPALTMIVNFYLCRKLAEMPADLQRYQIWINANMLFLSVAVLVVSIRPGASDDSGLIIF